MKVALIGGLVALLTGLPLALLSGYLHVDRDTIAVVLTMGGPAIAGVLAVTVLALLSPGEVPV